jgi:hypothetical protein
VSPHKPLPRLGLGPAFQGQLGPAQGLKPKPAHHYCWQIEGGWRGQHSDMQTSVRCEHMNVGQSLPSLVEFSALSLSWPTPRSVCHVVTGFSTSAVCSPNRCVAPHVALSWPLAVFPMLLLASSFWGLPLMLGWWVVMALTSCGPRQSGGVNGESYRPCKE